MGFGGWHGGSVGVATVVMAVAADQYCGGFAWWWLGFFPWCRGWVCLVSWWVSGGGVGGE